MKKTTRRSEDELAFCVCLSRWASWGSSDARRFRQMAFSPLKSRLCQEIADPNHRVRTRYNTHDLRNEIVEELIPIGGAKVVQNWTLNP